MLSFDINIQEEFKKNFRVAQLQAFYEYSDNVVKECFCGKIETPQNWKYGLIYGNSGTGKTTISKSLQGQGFAYIDNLTYGNNSVINEFDKSIDLEKITKTFTLVGFSSVPSWFKPYSVLSNGEKMRVDLSKAILENEKFIFDEFTSVVDREAAQMMCKSMNFIKNDVDKQIIFVTCHQDVKYYLDCDWIFCTDTMKNEEKPELKKKHFSLIDAKEKTGTNLSVITI